MLFLYPVCRGKRGSNFWWLSGIITSGRIFPLFGGGIYCTFVIVVVAPSGGTPLYVFVAFLLLDVVLFVIEVVLFSDIWDKFPFESCDDAFEEIYGAFEFVAENWLSSSIVLLDSV